ncbi:MAG: glycosyl transferase, partial [Pseudomonadota bacterium]
KIFLGDVGSLPLGGLLAWFMISLAASGEVLAALLLPGYYLLDATRTLYCRWRNGEDVKAAHRKHAYQRAQGEGGMAVPDIAEAVVLANILLAVLAILSVYYGNRGIDALCALGGVIVLYRLMEVLETAAGRSTHAAPQE